MSLNKGGEKNGNREIKGNSAYRGWSFIAFTIGGVYLNLFRITKYSNTN